MKHAEIMDWWQRHRLEVLVFLMGAGVLVMEITATRIISPHYGNTIFSFSAVISVILGGLSLGYAHGGKRADANPTFYEFYRTIYKSGVALALLFAVAVLILPIGGHFFSLKTGPLVWSMILFFPASYVMGMLSPFAIRLAHDEAPKMGLGSMSGNIFFWSTAGSIAGSLAAGFILIPHMGITAIMFSTSTAILLIAAAGLATHARGAQRTEAITRVVLVLIMLTIIFFFTQGNSLDPRIRYTKDGVYEKLTVLEFEHAGRPARFFLQDRSVSGGIFLDGNDLVAEYTKYYKLYMLREAPLTRALVLGAGIYTMPRMLHEENPDALIDVVDIEPTLEHIAKEYFKLPDTENIRTYTEDGRGYLREKQNTYDIIVSDVYSSLYSIPTHFTTREFFHAAADALRDDGIFFANIIGDTAHADESLLYSEIRTMQDVFAEVIVFGVVDPKKDGIQNFIVVGKKSPFERPITTLLSEHPDPFLAKLSDKILETDAAHLLRYDIFTDDYAPVDHLVAGFLGKKVVEDPSADKHTFGFSGDNALRDIAHIVSLGSRAVGTKGNATLRGEIIARLEGGGIDTHIDAWVHTKKDGGILPLQNIIGRIEPERTRRIILGTHYDSIGVAYRDKYDRSAPMPGANNSASGVALLLEAIPALQEIVATSPFGIDIVFFDGEEGELGLGEGDDAWRPLGSSHFASTLALYAGKAKPEQSIVFDMICDKELNLKKEKSSLASFPEGVNHFWNIGAEIAGTEIFSAKDRVHVSDDHTPLIAAGIPSMLIIDFDYAWYNTQEDTTDKCSTKSLEAVGHTLLAYIKTLQ